MDRLSLVTAFTEESPSPFMAYTIGKMWPWKFDYKRKTNEIICNLIRVNMRFSYQVSVLDNNVNAMNELYYYSSEL